jgi:predicted  nucleic acid-binding Zn-ribbon protein
LSELSGLSNGGGVDMDSIHMLLNNYMKKSDFDDFLKRLGKLEKKHKKWKPKWKKMEKDIDELKKLMKTKVDSSLFDEEMERLKNAINSISSSGGEVK